MIKTNYPLYPRYKPSGIDWLGNIPEDWEVKKLKFVVTQKITDGPHETPVFVDKGVSFLSVDSIQDGKLVFDNCRQISEDDHKQYIKKCKPEKLDILLGKAASIGKIALVNVDFEFSVWSPLALIKPDKEKIKSRFLEQLLKSNLLQDQINILSTFNTQQNISMDDIGELLLLRPSINEQEQIITFLDLETGKIDQVIEKNNRLVELLKEKRQAVITRAVTKGLNPHARLKPSGIDWLGNIPEDWKVKRIKYVVEITLGKMLQPSSLGNDYLKPYLRAENISWEKVNISNVKDMWLKNEEIKKLRLAKNDLLVSEGGEVGRCALWQEELDECYFQNSINRVRVSTVLNSNFLMYLLEAIGKSGFFEAFVNKVSIGHLTKDKLKEINIIYPKFDKQKVITEFLDRETRKIDETVKKLQLENGKLLEYKQALISSAVTGKIRV